MERGRPEDVAAALRLAEELAALLNTPYGLIAFPVVDGRVRHVDVRWSIHENEAEPGPPEVLSA